MAALTDRLVHVIGAKSAKPLEEHLGLVTVDDLLRHYPRAYSKGATILEDGESPPWLREGDHVTFVDVIEKAEAKWTNRQPKREFLVITLAGRKPKVTATFFNARYTKRTLVVGTRLMLSGVVGYFRNALQLTHPAFLILEGPQAGKGSKSLAKVASTTDDGEVDLSVFERDFFPIYPATAKVQSWDLYACIRQVLDVLDPVDDPLPQSLKDQFYLFSQDEALRAIHLTENEGDRDRARERLAMDEAVGLQWALMLRRHGDLAATGPIAPVWDGGIAAALRRQLPFELTAGQREVLEVLTAELASTTPMHRMLQGEVGSGKTIVSVIAMAQMVDAGYQCALLAPTEVLAAQHARSIRDVLGPLAMAGELGGDDGGTRVALLTGSMTAPQKRQVREEIASGAAGIVIGTHALIQDSVEFRNLGLVVVDEQHRFGVDQRDRLRAKASDGITPHLLVMTATPIPRTVALTVYGDLETSTLRELPRGRQPISTTAIFTREGRHKTWLGRAWQRVREEVAAGRQAYVVASRIDESEKDGAAQTGPPAVTVLELLEGLGRGELAGLRLGLMHGRLSGDEKDAVMTAFRAGQIDVLVCTTVIEVGVDVPNATVMVVMDADRFGISQLHQLRGRIGRGQHPSVCLLVTNLPEASKAGARLKAVASTLDGFALADLDLAERREGDVLGLTQSGRPITLKMLSLAEHRSIIEAAREFAEHVYETDPRLVEHRGVETLAAPFVATEAVEYLDKA